MYGISRIDDEAHRTHAWRVSLSRRGERFVKNFPDQKWGGKRKALAAAKDCRDQFIQGNPPLSRREFCSIIRSNNKTGITGVYRFSKSFKLKNGQIRESWYWEASWPIGKSRQSHITFSVNELGERRAKQLAIAARRRALEELEGDFWASARGGNSTGGAPA